MYFKRNEPLRYSFDEPINGALTKLNEHDTVTISVLLLDVSNQGAKIKCKNNIVLSKEMEVKLAFTLNSVPFHALGKVSWTKSYRNHLEIGLQLDTNQSYQKNMIATLKELAKAKQMNIE
ncbi:PilZ domain-containing protein [Virgibacillus ndiopensis]|uniref:PilZ domain-containing protein n=1 Tax=Virgibacillus ndiopensis TaxID=2004408 RepID=UPI000C08A435|nr:PilZ domain-containing protein [Virgibacillus ndiopensis]